METELLPTPPAPIRSSLDTVLRRAAEQTQLAPPWVAVEDDAGSWVSLASRRPRAERARAVVAAASEEALVTAIRLGIGGAVRLPASTAAMEDAVRSAAACQVPIEPGDVGIVQEVTTTATQLWAVSWRHLDFWRSQLSDSRLFSFLAMLAEALTAPPALLCVPVLLLGDYELHDITAAAARLVTTTQDRLIPTIDCLPIQLQDQGDHNLVGAVYRALAAADPAGEQEQQTQRHPVYELLTGQLVGWWGLTKPTPQPSHEWHAEPIAATSLGFRWRLCRADGPDVTVEDTVTSTPALQSPVARVAGWATNRLCTGSPAGLLIESLASAAKRRGTTLWVPSVDHLALQLLLRLKADVWVDGPAVPDHGISP